MRNRGQQTGVLRQYRVLDDDDVARDFISLGESSVKIIGR